MKTHHAEVHSVFHPHEHAILSHWLGVAPPEGTPAIDTLPFDPEDIEGVGLESGDAYEDPFKTAVSNAVARIVLGAIQDRLPQWAVVEPDGTVVFARKPSRQPSHQHRLIATMPQHLFTINWADSGPGFSWPEAYYATWLPYYDVWVVTASQDGPDAYGYADLAIGWFAKDVDLLEGCRDVIRDQWWQYHFDEYDQQHWAYLFGTGLIDEATAYAWAQKVWDAREDDAPGTALVVGGQGDE